MQHQYPRLCDSRRSERKGGFTLVEIIVVLVIATLLSSILFAAFKSVNEGNKKSSCQNNLVQIYQALRQYGQDNEGNFPAYNPAGVVQGRTPIDEAPNGLGLWALYAYPQSNALDCDERTTQLPPTEEMGSQSAPLASYIKSPRFFHCPYDSFEREMKTAGTACKATAGSTLDSSILKFTGTNGVSYFNPYYNSYQTDDDIGTAPLDRSTYSTFRKAGARRQLAYFSSENAPSKINRARLAPDTTIITWCRFHRKLDDDGNTVSRPSNSDNVLLMDGTVQYLPTTQDVGTSTPVQCEGWKRVPRETAELLTTCQE